MYDRATRNVTLGIGVLLLGAGQVWGDTAAGMQAFRAKDYPRAYQEWKAAADAGQAEAEFDVGVLYAQGLGVKRDLTAAMNWYRKAAEQGNAEAEFALGQMYSRGWGVPRDETDALRWMEMASDPVSDGPPTDWARIEGYGAQQDQKQAAYWYQQAAEKGHAEAQYNLGRLYASGSRRTQRPGTGAALGARGGQPGLCPGAGALRHAVRGRQWHRAGSPPGLFLADAGVSARGQRAWRNCAPPKRPNSHPRW